MLYKQPPEIDFQQQLENLIGIKLNLKINDNRSTMLSVRWEPDVTKVSLHRIFLQAPQNILEALGCYLKGRHKKISPVIKAFIEHEVRNLDYSRELDLSKLHVLGKVYNLQKAYQEVEEEYFQEKLNLHITWSGSGRRKKCNRITFGCYHDPLRLIKINRLIDHAYFPPYFLSYVIYHEMLHAVYPSSVNEKGYKTIHTRAFKDQEKKFKFYTQAKQWIRDNHHYLFDGCSH